MKYDERACKFNIDTGCVELLLRDGRKIFIGCTGVEDALDVTVAQRVGVGLSHLQRPTGLCGLDFEWRPRGIFEECSREPWVRRLRAKNKRCAQLDTPR